MRHYDSDEARLTDEERDTVAHVLGVLEEVEDALFAARKHLGDSGRPLDLNEADHHLRELEKASQRAHSHICPIWTRLCDEDSKP